MIKTSFLILILVFTGIFCGCGKTAEKTSNETHNPVAADTTANASSVSDKFTIEMVEYTRVNLHNTIGFVSIVEQDKLENFPNVEPDTINAIKVLNEDNSVWMQFYPDFNYLSMEKRDKAWNRLFNPWALIPELDVLVLRCIAKTDKGYTVVVNEKKEMTKLVANHPRLKFETLEEHLLHVLLEPDFETNPLRKEPSETSDMIDIKDVGGESELIYGCEIKNDWIKLKDGDENILGWVKWKNKNNLVVKIYYAL